jgi:hypothetical protein
MYNFYAKLFSNNNLKNEKKECGLWTEGRSHGRSVLSDHNDVSVKDRFHSVVSL